MIRSRTNSEGQKMYQPLVKDKGRNLTAAQVLGPGTPGSYPRLRDAERVERRMRDTLDDQRRNPQPDRLMTISEYADFWLEHRPRPKASTNRLNRDMIRRFTDEHGDTPLVEFKRGDAQKVATANANVARTAKAMFNNARLEDGELTGMDGRGNPFEKVTMKPRGKGTLALTVAEIDQLAQTAERALPGVYGIGLRAAILFSAYTGLRRNELFALEWSWFNEDRTRLRVHGQMPQDHDTDRRMIATKNGTGSTQDATRPAQEIAVLPPAREVLDTLPRTIDGPVFIQPYGGQWTANFLTYRWGTVRKEFLKLPHPTHRLEDFKHGLKWHTLRHSHATILARAGFDRWEIKEQMRHADMSLVDDVYVNLERQEVFDRMVEAFVADTPTRTAKTEKPRA